MLIVCASILVSTPSLSHDNPCELGSDRRLTLAVDSSLEASDSAYETAIGFGAVLAEVTLSGFAS